MGVSKNLLKFLLFSLIAFAGCKQKAEPAKSYQVISYDGKTHEWTLVFRSAFNEPSVKRRLVVVCLYHELGKTKGESGPEACHLDVGRVMIDNFSPKSPDEKLDIWENPDQTLWITEGSGDDEVKQNFSIVKNEILPQ